MNSYVKVITPQFSQTSIGYQRVPTVDKSFISRRNTIIEPNVKMGMAIELNIYLNH
jgi:phosphoribulokinase